MPSLNRHHEYSTAYGAYWIGYLCLIQILLMAFLYAISTSWIIQHSQVQQQPLLMMALVTMLILFVIVLFWQKRKQRHGFLAFGEGVWGYRSSKEQRYQPVQPLESSRLFPHVLMIVFRTQQRQKHYAFIWIDVIGDHQFRQLNRQLQQYFFLRRKSQASERDKII